MQTIAGDETDEVTHAPEAHLPAHDFAHVSRVAVRATMFKVVVNRPPAVSLRPGHHGGVQAIDNETSNGGPQQQQSRLLLLTALAVVWIAVAWTMGKTVRDFFVILPVNAEQLRARSDGIRKTVDTNVVTEFGWGVLEAASRTAEGKMEVESVRSSSTDLTLCIRSRSLTECTGRPHNRWRVANAFSGLLSMAQAVAVLIELSNGSFVLVFMANKGMEGGFSQDHLDKAALSWRGTRLHSQVAVMAGWLSCVGSPSHCERHLRTTTAPPHRSATRTNDSIQ
jgi:hypothetical protein